MSNEEILEVTDFLYKGYPGFNKTFTRWRLLSLIDRNTDKVEVIRDKEIKGVALYLKLTDKSLNLLDFGVIDLKSPEVVTELIKEDGDNIHFVAVLADGAKTILKGLRKVIKKHNPKTITWFKPNMDRIHFVKLGGELCHH